MLLKYYRNIDLWLGFVMKLLHYYYYYVYTNILYYLTITAMMIEHGKCVFDILWFFKMESKKKNVERAGKIKMFKSWPLLFPRLPAFLKFTYRRLGNVLKGLNQKQ